MPRADQPGCERREGRPLQAPAAGLGLHRYRMLSPLFCEKTQLELEAHAAQDVARAVADRDRVMRAVVE